MSHDIIIATHYKRWGNKTADYLRQEIAFLEARLSEMEEKGNSAYEHAFSKAYTMLLQERKNQLANFRSRSNFVP